MSDDKELKPCPFCGGKNLDISQVSEVVDYGWYVVDCFDCVISGPMRLGEDEAIKAWNTRAK